MEREREETIVCISICSVKKFRKLKLMIQERMLFKIDEERERIFLEWILERERERNEMMRERRERR